MSHNANCYDNSITETLFHSLKIELMFLTYFATRADAQLEIFTYVEELYNRICMPSLQEYFSTVKFEQQYVLAP